MLIASERLRPASRFTVRITAHAPCSRILAKVNSRGHGQGKDRSQARLTSPPLRLRICRRDEATRKPTALATAFAASEPRNKSAKEINDIDGGHDQN